MKQLWLLLSILGVSGCGYHVSSQSDLVPKNIKTIAIEPFGNITPRYQLSRLLPEDIAREFLSRTRYKVVKDSSGADAVLTGSVVKFVAFPTTIDNATSRATAVQAIVTLQLKLVDRATGMVIYNQPNGEFRQIYQVSENPQLYFDESGTAMIRLSRDVARSLVSAVLQKF